MTTMIGFKWPLLLIEVAFLFVGIALIFIGIKTRKQSKSTFFIMTFLGVAITLLLSWALFWTLLVGYNS